MVKFGNTTARVIIKGKDWKRLFCENKHLFLSRKKAQVDCWRCAAVVYCLFVYVLVLLSWSQEGLVHERRLMFYSLGNNNYFGTDSKNTNKVNSFYPRSWVLCLIHTRVWWTMMKELWIRWRCRSCLVCVGKFFLMFFFFILTFRTSANRI